MIPYGRHSVDDDDIAAVVQVLKGDWLTQGPAVPAFERAIAEQVEANYAVAFSSGTAALHAATSASGLGPGDVVATSPLTFVASANCSRYVGAHITLVDIDPKTLLLDPTDIPNGITALVAVHYAGLPLDLTRLPYRPRVVIEDAAHALGARTPDGPVGNCARSDMAVFSFHPVKHITTGEGGMITTNDAELANELRKFRSHGIIPTPEHGGWAYNAAGNGFNYRFTDIQAALGMSQLRKLGSFVTRRNELAERYRELLTDLPVVTPPPAPAGFLHAYHLFPIQVSGRDKVYEHMWAAGIGVQVHYVPLHRHDVFADLRNSRLPHADGAYSRLLSLPLFPTLTEAEQDLVVRSLADAL